MKKQVKAAAQLNLQRAKGDEGKVASRALGKGVTREALGLMHALLDAQAKQSHATKLFRAKCDSAREVTACPQLAQSSLRCATLSLVELRSSKRSQMSRVGR